MAMITNEKREKEEKRTNVMLSEEEKKATCYIPGCYNLTVEPCEGELKSYTCASCRRRRVTMPKVD